MTTPRKTDQPRVPQISQHAPEEATQPDDLYVGETKLQSNAPIPLSISVLASIPGLRFSGEVSRNDDSQAAVVALSMRRSANLIRVSFAVMVVMMGLAVGVLAMALKMTTQKKFDLIPLSWSIMLIFGLPALRNIQPGVPAVGTLGDYFSFVWAELFVAASAIIVICTWLFRSESD